LLDMASRTIGLLSSTRSELAGKGLWIATIAGFSQYWSPLWFNELATCS
jgi:hypothetical protein